MNMIENYSSQVIKKYQKLRKNDIPPDILIKTQSIY
jgi:hypothetical protein